jgi:hypothetical protein
MKMQWADLHQWGLMMEPQAHLERVVANRVMEGYVVALLNIWKALIPYSWILGVVHVHDMHNHPIDHFCLSIYLGVEGRQFG